MLELEKNRTLGRMVTVETQAPNQKPITKLITLEDPRKVAEYLITQMPYAGEKEKDGSITPPKSPTIGEACKEARNSVPC